MRLADLPAGATLNLIPRYDGYEAVLHIGEARLGIARPDAAVPEGGDVRDAAYHAALDARFDSSLGPKAHGQATTVGGHAAWTSYLALDDGFGRVQYQCETYAIVDHYVYRIAALASGARTRPPDFESALRVMSDMSFKAVERPAVDAEARIGMLVPPHMDLDMTGTWRPDDSRAPGLQGRAGLEFSIDAKGRARDIEARDAEPDSFAKVARRNLESIRFRVNPDWQGQGYDKVRFAIEFQYWLGDSRGGCTGFTPPKNPAAIVAGSCASHLRPR